jgi:SAM-dependent methyltransferase
LRLNDYERRVDLLIDWIRETVPAGAEILDIGASDGSFCPELDTLARDYVIDGVDPDTTALARNPRLRHRHEGVLEEASIAPESYDAAVAVYVAEHVEDPQRFLSAAYSILRPGGSLFLITPNGDHYFARVSKLLDRLRLQERVLRVLRPADLVDRYHHSARYRLNKPSVIRKLGAQHGFDRVDLRFSERYEEIACYFPGPTKLIPRAWEWFVERTGKEHLLGNLMVRMVKKREE